jgi:hypothetical protein
MIAPARAQRLNVIHDVGKVCATRIADGGARTSDHKCGPPLRVAVGLAEGLGRENGDEQRE